MGKEPATIVALFARGRDLSYAVFHEGVLIRFGMKSIRGKRRGTSFQRAVADAIIPLLGSSPSPIVVMERSGNESRLGALYRTLSRLQAWGCKKECICLVSLSEAKNRWCGSTRATHDQLQEAVLSRHAALHACPRSTVLGISLAVALGETARAI